MKKIIFIVAFAIIATTASAQSGFNYREWAFGLEVSGNKPFVDIQKVKYGLTGNASIIYNYSPYLPVALEFQMGNLSGGGVQIDKDTRAFNNNYKALLLHADLQLGEVLDYSNYEFYNYVKGFYVGTGLGLISNDNQTLRNSSIVPSYVFPGTDKSTNLVIPIRFGYEFKIYNDYDEPDWRIDIGWRHNITLGEGLDGYNDPSSKFKNNSVDQYVQLSLGVKYSFGRTVAYNKLIRRFGY